MACGNARREAYTGGGKATNIEPRNIQCCSKRTKDIAEQIRDWDKAVLRSPQVLRRAGTRLPRGHGRPEGIVLVDKLSDAEIIALGRHAVCGGKQKHCLVVFTKTEMDGLALISRIGNTRFIRRFRAERRAGTGVKANAEILEVPDMEDTLPPVEKLIKRKAERWGNLHLDP